MPKPNAAVRTIATGTRFGKLEVISACETMKGRATYLCRCDCGKVKFVQGGVLLKGQQSCGCLKGKGGDNATSRNIQVGERFGMLTVLGGRVMVAKKDHPRSHHLCRCDCGAEKEVQTNHLITGWVKSCGCQVGAKARERMTKHGQSRTRLYNTWCHMISRCEAEYATHYKDYGGRGISIDPEWREDFTRFRQWAMENGYTDDLTIERIDVDKNYCPENCCWIPGSDQAYNTRNSLKITAYGETKVAKEWSRDPRVEITYMQIRFRLQKGLTGVDALTK